MQRRNPTEALHLRDGEITNADGADLSLLIKHAHCLGGFLDGHQRVGPMDLIDVDIVGAQAAQRFIDLPQNPLAGCVSIDLAVAPLKTHLGGDDDLRAQARGSDRFADDLLGCAEAVRRGRIDQIDALIQSGADRGDRFMLVGSAPHPAAHRPGSERHARYTLQRPGNSYGLRIDRVHLRLV